MVTGLYQLVKVQYHNPAIDKFVGREYTYYSADNLKVGDIVTVPVRDTTGKAIVTAVDVPESTIEKFRDMVKTIPAGSVIGDLVKGTDVNVESEMVEIPVVGTIGTQTVLINIDPLGDPSILPFIEQVNKLKQYAQIRVIATDDDVKAATEDLVTMATLKKTLAGKYKEWTGPINEHLAAVRSAFNQITDPLTDADVTTRMKIQDYRAAQAKLQKEVEVINSLRAEAAAKEAAMNEGEITESVKEIPVPEVVSKVRTEIGTLGTMKVRKYRITDFGKLPDMYKIENSALLNKVTKAGIPEIPGVEFYFEESLTVRSK